MRKRRTTVTGGAGFLGQYVVEALSRRGCDVFVPKHADYDTHAQGRRAAHVRRRPARHRDSSGGGRRWPGRERCQPGEVSERQPADGPVSHRAGAPARRGELRHVGTICEYPKVTPVPFREESLWDGYPDEATAPYGIAKKTILVQGQVYRQQYGFDAIHLLPVNLYGPRDNFDPRTSHVVPALIRKCVEAIERGDHSVACWGDGTATREFLYVGDCAEAIVLATECYTHADPVNLGSGREVSMRELITLISELVGFTGEIVWDTTMPKGQPRRCLDTSRAAERFGFQATTDFREGLARTVDWYRESRR